jgi:predicted ATPase
LVWTPIRITEGFFFKAESFFNFSSYLDKLAINDANILKAYGGKPLNKQSHWESFLSLFNNKFNKGIYILDEPESALSPNNLLSFLIIINKLITDWKAQFLIATHSPILLTYPWADVFSLNKQSIRKVKYHETECFSFTKDFIQSPSIYYKYLFRSWK